MTVEAYFDGTAVRPLQTLDLKPNQKVYVTVPPFDESDPIAPSEESESDRAERIKRQLAAIDGLCGLLTPEEADALDRELAHKVTFPERF